MVFYHAPMRPVHDPLRRLRQLDLNLLLAFDALADAGGVTAAAQTLGLSQSAMSHTLGRLRVALGDPLLVRAGAKMALTPRAEALKGPVRDALLDLERAAFFEEGFEPGSSERTFRMRSPDLFDLLILPPLYRRLHERAPGVDLLVRPLGGPGLEAELSEGIIDLAVVPVAPWSRAETKTSERRRKGLLEDRHHCFLRRGHRFEGGLDLEQYLSADHLLVAPDGDGPGLVDRLLEQQGLFRRVALRVPSFAVAHRLVAESDLVLTAPASLGLVPGAQTILQLEPPLDIAPHNLALTWHARQDRDPGLQWFRAEVAATVQSVRR